MSLQHLISQNSASRSRLCGVFSWVVDTLLCLAGGRRRHHDDVAVAVAPRRPLGLFRLPHSVLQLAHGAPEDTTAIAVVILGLVTMSIGSSAVVVATIPMKLNDRRKNFMFVTSESFVV